MSRRQRCYRAHPSARSFAEPLERRTLLSAAVDFLAASTVSSGGSLPYSVAVGDFNNDGNDDLAAANLGDERVGVLLGNGSGGFTNVGSFATGTTASWPLGSYWLVAADFDKDGNQDIAVANLNRPGGTVGLLLGNGNGTFGTPTTFNAGGEAVYIVAGDLNRDGYMDVVTANYVSGNLGVLLNNRAGGFGSVVNYAIPDSNVYSVALEDFDGDGDLDIAAMNAAGGTIHVLSNNMPANSDSVSFTFAQTVVTGCVNPTSVVAADFNNDGHADLSATDIAFTGHVALALGDGTLGTAHSFATAILTDSGGSRPIYSAAADFNHDGPADLAVCYYGSADSDHVGVLSGRNGTQGFEPAAAVFPIGGGTEYSAPAVGDFNNDGKEDLAVVKYSGVIAILLNTTDLSAQNQAPTASAGGPYTIQEGDSLSLDGSGSSDPDNDALTYSWDINGDGTFGDAAGETPTLTWSQLLALGIDDGPHAPYNVKVKVDDGHNHVVDSAPATLTLENTAPTATLGITATVIAQSPATVSLSNPSDPSSTDTTAGFRYSYASSAAGLATTYAAATDGSSKQFTFTDSGTHTVYARVFDKDDGYTTYQTTFTVTATGIIGGDLIIGGGSATDSVVITPSGGGVNVQTGGVSNTFSQVGRIIIRLGDGNDQFNVAASINVPLLIDGGAGDDTLKGAGGDDIILGGPGNDRLMGGNGRDLLIGGVGADRILGDQEDDILVAGTTTHDSDPNALEAILSEWTSSRTFAERVSNLRGTGSGTRNNGSFFLQNGISVLDDGDADSLSGNAGNDWFVFNGSNDVATDISATEFGVLL